MKTLHSMINEAEIKRQFWVDVSNDPKALEGRGKSRQDALALAGYFEGRYDGLCDALRIAISGRDFCVVEGVGS